MISLITTPTITYPPLTTIFTPPPDCATRFSYIHGMSVLYKDYELFWETSLSASTGYLSCYPPGLVNPRAWGVYSPGICPDGYSTASLNPFGPTATAICCQNAYTFDQQSFVCQSTYLEPTTIPSVGPSGTRTVVANHGIAVAPTIKVLYQQADLGSFPKNITPAFVPTVEPIEPLSQSKPSGIVLAVIVAIGGLVLVLAIFLSFFYSRRLSQCLHSRKSVKSLGLDLERSPSTEKEVNLLSVSDSFYDGQPSPNHMRSSMLITKEVISTEASRGKYALLPCFWPTKVGHYDDHRQKRQSRTKTPIAELDAGDSTTSLDCSVSPRCPDLQTCSPSIHSADLQEPADSYQARLSRRPLLGPLTCSSTTAPSTPAADLQLTPLSRRLASIANTMSPMSPAVISPRDPLLSPSTPRVILTPPMEQADSPISPIEPQAEMKRVRFKQARLSARMEELILPAVDDE